MEEKDGAIVSKDKEPPLDAAAAFVSTLIVVRLAKSKLMDSMEELLTNSKMS